MGAKLLTAPRLESLAPLAWLRKLLKHVPERRAARRHFYEAERLKHLAEARLDLLRFRHPVRFPR